MQRIFHYRPKYVIFSPVKIPFFSNRRALWIKLNKFIIKNLTCNDGTTVCICYVLLILHLYLLSCPYSSWTNANCLASLFLHLPKTMDKKKEHCYHSYFCFLKTLFVTNWVTKHLCLLNRIFFYNKQTNSRPTLALLSLREFSRHSLSKWAVFPALNGRYLNIETDTVTL